MSNFIAIDGQSMTLKPNSHSAANLAAPSPTHDSVFLQLKFSTEAGGPIQLQSCIPYYELGTTSPGSEKVNFKLEFAEFNALTQTITVQLLTNKTVASELNVGLTKVLNSGAKAQLTVEIVSANAKQTVDQANKGTIVQYFNPQGAKFTLNEEETREFQATMAQECGDSYIRTADQNKTELTRPIVISGKWEKGTPISTWSGDSTQKIIVGIDAGS